MPETRLVEDEPTRADQAAAIMANVLAGQGIVRVIVLYLASIVALISPWPMTALVPLALLMATDARLS